MGMAVDADDEFEDVPISNPLPPPPRPPNRDRKEKDIADGEAARLENLSNDDFRRMVMETPRRVEDQQSHHYKDRHRGRKKGGDEEEDGEKQNQKKYRSKPKEEEVPELPELPKYRDRAKERREDQNPDYDHTAAELGSLHAVAPPGTVDLRTTDAHRISIENSKFLGGDVEHTHLVKGLDYALLHKVRSEIDKRPEGSENGEDGKRRVQKEDQTMSFRAESTKLIYQWIVKPEVFNKPNEMFLPGRTAFVFDMDDEFSHDIPLTVHRSKADCPPPQETVTVGVDGTVLDRIAKIMSYLRLGSSGKMLKKKKKEKIEAKVKSLSMLPHEEGGLSTNHEKLLEAGSVSGMSKQQKELASQKGQKELQASTVHPAPHEDEDDIFQGVGTNYVPDVANDQSPLSEDMEESPREGDRPSYLVEPSDFGPAPAPVPAPASTMGQDWPQQGVYDAIQGPVLPSSYEGDWQGYPPPPPEVYAVGQWLPDQYAYPDQYLHSQIPDYSMQTSMVPPKDPRFMTQEEKDRGFGSVFKRDDERLQQRRERDAREKDPNFISESYSECYPGYQEYNREIVDSDDEEDLTKMDMGGRAKGRLHRWDFETEEEWAKYNEQKEAMPKAAFQFGVKMQDGRKTRKQNKDQKLNNELHKINQILDRKKREKMDKMGAYEEAGHYDNDILPGKRLRV